MSRCLSRTEPFWLSAIYGYKAVVQALGLYFAFKIRNVKIRGLNDSREVSIALYVTTVVIVAMIVVTFVFGDYIDVDGFVYGFGVSTAVTFVLCLTFIPKVTVCLIHTYAHSFTHSPTHSLTHLPLPPSLPASHTHTHTHTHTLSN